MEVEFCINRFKNFDDFCRLYVRRLFCDEEKYSFFIIKYNFDLNVWELIGRLNYLYFREDMCIVVYDDFVYFIGGIKW